MTSVVSEGPWCAVQRAQCVHRLGLCWGGRRETAVLVMKPWGWGGFQEVTLVAAVGWGRDTDAF